MGEKKTISKEKPYAQDYPLESITLLHSLIARGLSYRDVMEMASDFYNYDDHMRTPTARGGIRKKPMNVFKSHYSQALDKYRGEVSKVSSTTAGAMIDPPRLNEKHVQNIISREEGLAILSDIARGKPRVAKLESMDLEVPIVPNARDQARAIQLIFTAMGWEAPKKVDVSMTLIDQLGAAGIIVDKNDQIDEAEVVEDSI